MAETIVLVEDNPDHALLIQAALEGAPGRPRVTLLANGEQALNYVRSATAARPGPGLPNLVLLDLKLPKVDGLAVLRAMRASAAWQEVPVVVLTTSNRPADIDACYASGANAYVSKVASPEKLATSIREAAARWLGAQA